MLWQRTVTTYLCVVVVLLLMVVAPVCDGRRKGRGRRPPCPSRRCQCRWGGGRYRKKDIRVTCLDASEEVPRFRQTDTVYTGLSLASRNISKLPADAFFHIRTRSLDLSDNWLDSADSIDPEAFRGLEKELETLSLRENDLPVVPIDSISPLSQLHTLRLEGNNITYLDARIFLNNTELRELYLYENRIHTMESDSFYGLHKLEHLKLMSNDLEYLPPAVFKGLTRLASLDLSNNRIHAIPGDTFNGLDSLQWLELQTNQLQQLSRNTFRGMKKLRHLKLESNPIKHVDRKTFKAIRKLRYLSMDIVYVEGLNPKIFKGLHKLKMLGVGEVNSSSLPEYIFAPLKNMEYMTLFNNTGKFDSLSENAFAADADISNLNIFVSPVRSCKCNVSWINALTSRGVWIRGQCGRKGRRLSCLVPGRRDSLRKNKNTLN